MNASLLAALAELYPVIAASDLLVIGATVVTMGIAYDSFVTIFFGLYDIAIGAVLVYNNLTQES